MKMLGANINDFKNIVELINKLLSRVGASNFSSPYSVIPVISQIIGLESTMMGSGTSPYSTISYIFQLWDKPWLKKELELSIVEKREIIDEIYNMIAPSLLKEEDKYIELLMNTKHREVLKSRIRKEKEFKRIMKEKLSFLSPLILKLCNKNGGDFAHLSHYGFLEDLYREQSFLKDFPKEVANIWFKYSFPIVTEITLRGFKGKNEIKGWIIFIANSTEQLIRDEKLRMDKILQAARLTERLGAKIAGMAGLIASFGKGGYYLTEHIKSVGFTTGHAFTLGAIIQTVKKCAEKVGLNLKDAVVAIVGAGGSIGSGCAKMLVEEGVKRLILIDTTGIVAYGRLRNLQNYIRKVNGEIDLALSTEVSNIKEADLVILATSSLKPIVKAEHLKSGAIVLDDSFPKNVSKESFQERKDIILLEAIVQLPLSLDIFGTRILPDLLDVSLIRLLTCKEVYGCFAETLALSLMGHQGSYGLGQSDPGLAKELSEKACAFGFSIAPLQAFNQIVSKEHFQRVSRMYNESKN